MQCRDYVHLHRLAVQRPRYTRLENSLQSKKDKELLFSKITIGHLNDGVILLLRSESFSLFLSYLYLQIPVRFN